jgi:hypothetical protein
MPRRRNSRRRRSCRSLHRPDPPHRRRLPALCPITPAPRPRSRRNRIPRGIETRPERLRIRGPNPPSRQARRERRHRRSRTRAIGWHRPGRRFRRNRQTAPRGPVRSLPRGAKQDRLPCRSAATCRQPEVRTINLPPPASRTGHRRRMSVLAAVRRNRSRHKAPPIRPRHGRAMGREQPRTLPRLRCLPVPQLRRQARQRQHPLRAAFPRDRRGANGPQPRLNRHRPRLRSLPVPQLRRQARQRQHPLRAAFPRDRRGANGPQPRLNRHRPRLRSLPVPQLRRQARQRRHPLRAAFPRDRCGANGPQPRLNRHRPRLRSLLVRHLRR